MWRPLLLVLLLAAPPAGADGDEPGAPPATFRDLLGDLAETADEVAATYSLVELRAPWFDDLVDLMEGDRVEAADAARASRVIERLRAWRDADRVEVLGRRIAANVATDVHFKDYVRATLWAPPFLIAYTDGDRLSDYDLSEKYASPTERSALRARVRERQASFQPALERYAATANHVYSEFLRRFGKLLSLRPLTDPFGGAPDLPAGVRSFLPGVPLVVFVFDGTRSFREHHATVVKSPFAQPRPYFDRRTSWVFTHAEDSSGEQARRVATLVTEQVLHWFARQRRRWKRPDQPEVLRVGFHSWWSGFTRDPAGKPAFTGVDPLALESARATKDLLARDGKPYPVHSVTMCLATDDWRQSVSERATALGLSDESVVSTFVQQAWAFWLFLDERGRHEAIVRLLDGILDSRSPREAFTAAFPEPQWEVLDAEFRKFLLDDLLARDPGRYREER